MSSTWSPTVSPPLDGEFVNSAVAGRSISQLASQTRALKDTIDGLTGQSGRIVFVNAPLGSETSVLDFVYFDASTSKFRPAIAEAIINGDGALVCGPKSSVVGMVLTKETSTSGSIVQIGRMNFSDLGLNPANMIANPVQEPFLPGRFWLSNSVPGKMTSKQITPAIQVGFFSQTECQVSIVHKDLFESHQHFRFDLNAKPSASQNYAENGWSLLGVAGASAIKRVDYFNAGSSMTPPQIIMCIRHAGGTSFSEADPARFEIYNNAGSLVIDKVTGGIDFADPASAGSTTVSSSTSWPAYGEWIALGFDTDIEISFIRGDGTYNNPLSTDAASLLDSTAKKFKLFCPQDLSGWTNANTFDLNYPTGAIYKYLIQSDIDLNLVFPPLPVSSAVIEMNGSSMVSGSDFNVDLSGIYWRLGFTTPIDYAPWPTDYSASDPGSMSAANARNLVLNFLKSNLGYLNSAVFSLKGVDPIVVKRCPDGADADAGHLQISIDLQLLESSDDPVISETSLVSISENRFQKGLSVSEITAGPGIKVENVTESTEYASRGVGKVKVSAILAKHEGHVSTVALRNAKESLLPLAGSYIDFVAPSSKESSGITIKFRLPINDVDLSQIKLGLTGKFIGSIATEAAAATQFGVFKAVFHILRPGFSLQAMSEENALDVQYWSVEFPGSYTAYSLLGKEFPFSDADPNPYDIRSATLVDNPNSLVALAGNGFLPGDEFVVAIDRVSSDGGSLISTYPGKIGLVDLRWALK